MEHRERLGAAMGIAIAAVWLHVALALVFAVAYGSTAGKGALAFLSVLWGTAYVVVAIGLERRHPDARPWGIALSALACGMAFAPGQIALSTQWLILVPLLWARSPAPAGAPRYSPPPVEEEGWERLERRPPLSRERRTRYGVPRAPWDTWD